MKPRLYSREHGSMLLLIVVATVFITILAITLVAIVRFLRRVDGIQDRRFSDTNTMNFALPPGDASLVIKANSWEWKWVDMDSTPVADVFPSQPSPVVVEAVLGDDGLVRLAMKSITTESRNWASMGIALNESGMPADQYWVSSLPVPPASQAWKLQRTTNVMAWEDVTVLQLRTNMPAQYQDQKTSGAFYRCLKQ